jgi:hypothetical protein
MVRIKDIEQELRRGDYLREQALEILMAKPETTEQKIKKVATQDKVEGKLRKRIAKLGDQLGRRMARANRTRAKLENATGKLTALISGENVLGIR